MSYNQYDEGKFYPLPKLKNLFYQMSYDMIFSSILIYFSGEAALDSKIKPRKEINIPPLKYM